jgi:hypothetical protein
VQGTQLGGVAAPSLPAMATTALRTDGGQGFS